MEGGREGGVKVEKGTCPSPPNNPNRYYRSAATETKEEATFQGRNDDLKWHIFDCDNGKQADKYAVTMKELAEYVGSTFAYGTDIRWNLEHEDRCVVPKIQQLPKEADDIDKRVWEKRSTNT
jgi:hypothetical protein